MRTMVWNILFLVFLTSCAETQQEEIAGPVDHHMHLRTQQMGQLIGSLCGVMAECDPASLDSYVTSEDAIRMLNESEF